MASDGRKNNGGHSTKGYAGRKPKADEIKLIEQMDAVLVPEKVWAKLAELVQAKDAQAIKTWLSYRFGQPKQVMDIETGGNPINEISISINRNE